MHRPLQQSVQAVLLAEIGGQRNESTGLHAQELMEEGTTRHAGRGGHCEEKGAIHRISEDAAASSSSNG